MEKNEDLFCIYGIKAYLKGENNPIFVKHFYMSFSDAFRYFYFMQGATISAEAIYGKECFVIAIFLPENANK